ncbi:phosphotransferase family protein [Pendulispora rubella]|uniref:phosphotransferase family protein n=1 Tax=Pendulispora rubella TaxID=2741070 RepID=UPI00374E1B23
MAEHLPPATPSSLLHGDLHGAKLLLRERERDAVVGWECAQSGDPAYKLAVAVQGMARSVSTARMLEGYERAGGGAMRCEHVTFTSSP